MWVATESQHWNDSAQAWLDFVDGSDPNRVCVLDPAMLRLCGDVQELRVRHFVVMEWRKP